METKSYKIFFTSGELSGRTFAIPPTGILIGKSWEATIRPGGDDIEIEHASLQVKEDGSCLVLQSYAETVFVDSQVLDIGREMDITTGAEVRLGKNLVFIVQNDESFVPAPNVPDIDNEATDETPTEEPDELQNQDKTRYASPSELEDLRRFRERKTLRQRASLIVAIIFFGAAVIGGFLYLHYQVENPVTWPGVVSGKYNDGEFRIHLPPSGKFLIYYPLFSSTRIKKEGDNCEVFTLLGKKLDVLFHLKLEVNVLKDGYIIPRRKSFEQWKFRAEKELGFTFITAPEQRFYAMSDGGIPYHSTIYTRTALNLSWQGVVSYLRYHNREIIFIREVPQQHYWRSESVVNNFGCFVASPEAVDSYWEIPDKMPENVYRTSLYSWLLEEMMKNVSTIDWAEVESQFAILLSKSGQKKDENMMKDVLGLLREFRDRQELWYYQACLAYQHCEQKENWERMRTIRNECLAKFHSPDKYRYTKIIKNIWTIDK